MCSYESNIHVKEYTVMMVQILCILQLQQLAEKLARHIDILIKTRQII